MKRLLTLLALAGLSAAAVACGDDSGDDDGDTPSTTKDASTDSKAPITGQQITNLGAECDAVGDCQGGSGVMCLQEIGGIDLDLPGGYCTATCDSDDDCGSNGACPVAGLSQIPVIGPIIAQSGFIPSNCIQTCKPDAGIGCSRAGYTCGSLMDALASSGQQLPAIPGGMGVSLPQLSQTYCLPPPPPRDGGVGDAGTRALILGGIDAGR